MGSCHFVDVPISAVADFYRRELSNLFWQEYDTGHRRVYGSSADWRTPEPEDTVWLEYYKLGDVAYQPYDLFLQLDISDSRGFGFPSATERTFVSLYLSRVPILSELPLPPNATHEETIRTGNTGIGPFVACSYEIAETMDGIVTYYMERLPSYGWYFDGEAFDPSTGEKIQNSMMFTWHFGGVETKNWGASIEIKTAVLPDNTTKVFLTAAGATNLR